MLVVDPNLGCDDPASNILTIIVNDDTEIVAEATNAEVCIGGDVVLEANISGGSAGLSYHWQTSPDGVSNWIDIGVSDGPFAAPTDVAGTFYYRVRVEDPFSGCAEVESPTVTVIVNEDAEIAAMSEDQESCQGGVVVLAAEVEGGSAGLTYQWQSSPDGIGSWTNVGAPDMDYTAPTAVVGTTYYRILIDDASSGCPQITSDPVTVTVYEDVLVTAVANNVDVCIGGDVSLTATVSGGSPACSISGKQVLMESTDGLMLV
jgi:hypothetical protein